MNNDQQHIDNDHLNIGVLVFEGMTSLDALGPFEVLARPSLP